jgi:DNA anti-recombination protein RmuC
MRKAAVALLYSCALASQQSVDELSAKSICDSNSVPDGGNDQCQLLQGSVGVVSHQKDAREGHRKNAGVGIGLVDYYQEDKKQHAKKTEDAKGLPEILKNIADTVGSTEAVSKDFEAIKSAATDFLAKVRSAVEMLRADIKRDETIGQIELKVRGAYEQIHVAATKLAEQLKKTESDFLGGPAEAMSEQFKTELKKVLDLVNEEAQGFATAFYDAAEDLGATYTNATTVCPSVSHGMEQIKEKAEKFAQDAFKLSPDGLDEALKEAIEKLPSTIREEIDRILEKAKEAVKEIEAFPKATQDLASGVAAAFGDFCSDQNAARHMEVGILSSLVVIVTMSFYL